MYKVDYHFKLLTTHLGQKPGEIANDLGVSKKELFRWLKEENSIPAEKIAEVSSYFKIDSEELYEEVLFKVSYSSLSEMANRLQNSLKETSELGDYNNLARTVSEVNQELVDILIEAQNQLNLKKV